MSARLSSLYDAGTLALQQGRLEDALSLLSMVAKRTKDPVLGAQALGNLGVGLRKQGRDQEARTAFETALEKDPLSTSARFNLANTLRALGELKASLSHYTELRESHPERADVANNMGAVLMAMGRALDAEQCFADAVQISPKDPHIWGNLAAAQAASGRTLAPLKSLQEALKLNPRSASLLVKLGHHLVEQGHLDAAAKAFRAALSVEPERLDASVGLATILHRKGDNDQAFEHLAPLVNAGTLSPNLVATWTQVCRRTGNPHAAIAPLKAQISRTRDPATQVLLQHNLGDVLDKTGQYTAAFQAYHAANSLRALRHDPAAHSAWIDKIIAQPIGSTTSNSADTSTIFIVGMPRSGTSLVEQILASHPQCHGAGELDELRRLSLMAAQAQGVAYPEALNALDSATLDRMAEAYLGRLKRESQGSARVTDKMPQNFLYLGLAAAMLPGARVIHCVRDPVDTALSCYFQNFKDTLAFTTRMDWLAQWTRDYARLMAHWKSHLNLPILEVPYADLCRDPEPWCRKIVAFTQLDWDPNCLDSHAHTRVVRTASYAQVRQPIYKTSIGRSEAYAEHIPELLALRKTFEAKVSSIEPASDPKTLGTGG